MTSSRDIRQFYEVFCDEFQELLTVISKTSPLKKMLDFKAYSLLLSSSFSACDCT